jgi:hypothetical protein
MALIAMANRCSRAVILVCILSALAITRNIHAADSGAQQPAKGSGFLNSLGGVLHRELGAQTNSTNRTIESLRSLDAYLSNTNSTTFQATNTTSLVNRLGSLLGGNSTAGTNSSTGTNLIAKMKDWLDAQHSAGTNASASTNALAQRSWMALTNWLATNAKTNPTAGAGGGTNMVQKVRDWAKQELQTHTNANDTMSPKLAALANLFQSTNNGWINVSTNGLNALTSLKTNAPAGSELEDAARRQRLRRRAQ